MSFSDLLSAYLLQMGGRIKGQRAWRGNLSIQSGALV
jgi:hypothetical protein